MFRRYANFLRTLTRSRSLTCFSRFSESARHHIKAFARFLCPLFKKHFAPFIRNDNAHCACHIIVQIKAALRALPLAAAQLRLYLSTATLRAENEFVFFHINHFRHCTFFLPAFLLHQLRYSLHDVFHLFVKMKTEFIAIQLNKRVKFSIIFNEKGKDCIKMQETRWTCRTFPEMLS